MRSFPDPLRLTEAALNHIFPLLGLGGNFEQVWNDLSLDDKRRLAFAIVPLWRFGGTMRGLEIAVRFFTGRQFYTRTVHELLPSIGDLTFGVFYDTRRFWLVGQEADPHDLDSIDLHVIDDNDDGALGERINRTLLERLIRIRLPAGLKVAVIYALFLDRFEDSAQAVYWIDGIGNGIGNIENGTLIQGPTDVQVAIARFTSSRGGNVFITANLVIESGKEIGPGSPTEAYVYFRVVDSDNFYYLAIAATDDGVGYHYLRLVRVIGGTETELFKEDAPTIEGALHHIAITCVETTGATLIKVALDGDEDPQWSYTDNDPNRPMQGKAGLGNEPDGSQVVSWHVFEVLPSPSEVSLVSAPAIIFPSRYSLAPGENKSFSVTGGAGKFDFWLESSTTGATLTKTADNVVKYTASGSGTDTLVARDAYGNEARAVIEIQ